MFLKNMIDKIVLILALILLIIALTVLATALKIKELVTPGAKILEFKKRKQNEKTT